MLQKNKMFRLFILTVCVLSVLVFACSCTGNSKKSLSSFVTVSCSGFSGEGTAKLDVDWEGIKKEVLGGIPSGGTALETYLEQAADLENSLSFVLDKDTDLSNGDTVTVSIFCTEAASVSYNIKLFDSFTTEANGYLYREEIDLFEALEVSFTGISPDVSVQLSNVSENDFLKTVTFITEKTDGLGIGDEVVVTAVYSKEQALSMGYIPLASTKTFVVQGVAYYPYSFDEVPSSLVKTLATLSVGQINERWKDYRSVVLAVKGNDIDRQPYLNNRVTDIQIKDPDLIEIVVLSRTDTEGSWFGSYNYVFFVYKTIVNDSCLNAETEIYQCVVYSDIFVDEFGKATYSQWNTNKPQYEMGSLDEMLTILQEEYSSYNYEVVLK